MSGRRKPSAKSWMKTRRTWKRNLQVARIELDGKIQKIKVCTRCLNAGKIKRAPCGKSVV